MTPIVASLKDKMARITLQISDDLYAEMKATIPWGQKKYALEAVLWLLVDAVKKDGHLVLGAVQDRRFKLVPLVDSVGDRNSIRETI